MTVSISMNNVVDKRKKKQHKTNFESRARRMTKNIYLHDAAHLSGTIGSKCAYIACGPCNCVHVMRFSNVFATDACNVKLCGCALGISLCYRDHDQAYASKT